MKYTCVNPFSGNFIGNVKLNIPYDQAAVDDETDTKSCNYPIQNEQDFQVSSFWEIWRIYNLRILSYVKEGLRILSRVI